MPSITARLPLLALTAAALAGCSTLDRIENIGKAPDLAPIHTQVAIPVAPPPAPGQIAMAVVPAPATNSLWQPEARSFFHDPRASRVGDILTVNVSVADAAKISDTTQRSRTNSD